MSDLEQTAAPPAVPTIPTRPEVPAWKLVLTLAVAGVAAGLLLVMLNQVTDPLIKKHARDALKAAVGEVLSGPARVVSLKVESDRFEAEKETNYEVDAKTLKRVFLGYDESDQEIGFAIAYELPGFADQIRLIFGYDPRTRKVLGMKVLFSKETPGLGDKIEKDADYVGSFDGAIARLAETTVDGRKVAWAELVPVKPGKGKGRPEEIDTITGATISTKKVVTIINGALKKLDPQLDRWVAEGAR